MHALLHPMYGHQGNRRVHQSQGVVRDAPVTSIGYWNLVASWSECRPNTRPVVSASDAGVFDIRNLASPIRPRGPTSSDAQPLGHFVGDDLEFSEPDRTEAGRQGDVGRIAAARDQYSTDPWLIVPGVKGIPTAFQKNLKPGAEVHRVRNRRHADVTEIAGTVAGRDVHAAAQGKRQMGKVAANPDPLLVAVPGCAR